MRIVTSVILLNLTSFDWLVLSQLLKTSLFVCEVWVSLPDAVKSDTVSPMACHRCDVSSELLYPGTKPAKC